MGGLPSARWAAQAARFATYAEGDAALTLTPVGGGTAIPFVHDQQGDDLEPNESGGLDRVVLVIMCRTILETAAQYTYGGETWTVDQRRPDYMGGGGLVHRFVLVRHAR